MESYPVSTTNPGRPLRQTPSLRRLQVHPTCYRCLEGTGAGSTAKRRALFEYLYGYSRRLIALGLVVGLYCGGLAITKAVAHRQGDAAAAVADQGEIRRRTKQSENFECVGVFPLGAHPEHVQANYLRILSAQLPSGFDRIAAWYRATNLRRCVWDDHVDQFRNSRNRDAGGDCHAGGAAGHPRASITARGPELRYCKHADTGSAHRVAG